jgi:hypothetical protein
MRRTNLTKKNKRHSRRHSNKRRINKRRSRRVRKFGGAEGYSDEDMRLFKQRILERPINRSFKVEKRDLLLSKLSSMPHDPNYVYQYDIRENEKNPYAQGIDRIDAFVQLGKEWE